MTRASIRAHDGTEVFAREVLPLPDSDGHNHATYIEGCWGCVLTLPFSEQAARVRRLRNGEAA